MPRRQEQPNVLKDNWYLILAVVVLLVGGAIAAFMSGDEEETLPETGVVGQVSGVDVVRLEPGQAGGDVPTIGYQDLTPDERDQKYIEDYQKKLAEDPDGADAAGTMMSLSVVYRRQLQYNDAAIVLEDIVEKFPESPHTRTAMIQLPEVYREAGDVNMARESYRRMMDHFPPDTQEHQWAKQQYDRL